MTKALLRKKVHKYVDQVDEKTLRMLDAMLTQALHYNDPGFSYLTDEQEKELDERVRRHESGESKTHSWEKVKEGILAKAKKKTKPR